MYLRGSMKIIDIARIMLALDQIEQYAKIGYWVVGVFCHLAIIAACYYAVRVCRAYMGS